jgi:ATPase subunit of ABC transporter with duplicated ATPase domains
MDEDVEDEDAGEEEGTDKEYEIERILDSSKEIFEDGEKAYFVKWKGYPEEENSWVRESDAPNADELISQFLDRRAKEKAAERKKASAKSRKSTDRAQETKEAKKRGRLSTKSKVESDEDEPERSPVQPIAKKQRKEKAQASVKVKESELEERDQVPEFTSMDKYLHLDSWDSLVERIETIERDEGGLWLYGVLTTGDTFKLESSIANTKFPQKVIKFYEENLRWKAMGSDDLDS